MINKQTCPNLKWGDGICNDYCNTEGCGYDAGDCNQQCNCPSNLWFNNECDESCNNTECSFDFYDCITDENSDANATCGNDDNDDDDIDSFDYIFNFTQDSDFNYNYNGPCYTSWIGDEWCDARCNVSDCSFDNGDNGRMCNFKVCAGNCAQSRKFLIEYLGSLNEPNELITMEEICDNQETIKSLAPEVFDGYSNCSDAFNGFDLNSNGFVGLHEGIIATQNSWGFDQLYHHHIEKLKQIDCSECLENKTLWDW